MSRKAQVRRLATALRRLVPPLLPVRVYTRKPGTVLTDDGERALGIAVAVGRAGTWTHFRVALEEGPVSLMLSVLVHEWAHCLSWEDGHEVDDDHGRLFRAAEDRIRRALATKRPELLPAPLPPEED